MNVKNNVSQENKKGLSIFEIILLFAAVLFLIAGVLKGCWYGLTYLPARQTSKIPARELEIRSGGQQCTLVIPSGTLQFRGPSRAAVGSKYKFDAEVTLESPLRFIDCKNGIPNWNINLEGQTTFVASDVKPFSSIRQPAFDRQHFAFNWSFVPEEEVLQYQSHLWMRIIITQQDQTVENWNLLVRDFPMENVLLFGQPIIIWLIAAAFSLLFGVLLLILFIQKRRRQKKKDVS